MSGSVCLVAAWVCWLTFRNAYLGLLLILLLLPFNLQVIVELWVAKVLLVFFWDSFIWTGWIGSSSFIHVYCLLVTFERLHNFSVTIPDVLKISMSAVTFVLQAVFNFQFFSLHCHIFCAWQFLGLCEGVLITLTCLIFLSPFQEFLRMSMPTVSSFLQIDSPGFGELLSSDF